MQTFLPLPSYAASARVLDNKRLGKQRLECKQILLSLGVPVGEHSPGKRGWKHHPAVRMWCSYEWQLALYAQVMCAEWRRRGFKDILLNQFVATQGELDVAGYSHDFPYWLGDESFHSSHRSNLLRKDQYHYGVFGWEEPTNRPYVWPDEDLFSNIPNPFCKAVP